MGTIERCAFFEACLFSVMTILVKLTGSIVIFSGVVGINFNSFYTLNRILSLEFMALGVFFLISRGVLYLGGGLFFILYFLVLLVCEGRLGLSLLVSGRFRYGGVQRGVYNRLVC